MAKRQKQEPTPAKGKKAEAPAPATTSRATQPDGLSEAAKARLALLMDDPPEYTWFYNKALDNRGEVKGRRALGVFKRHCSRYHAADIATAAVETGAPVVLRAAIPGRLQRILDLSAAWQPNDKGEWPEAARLLLEREGAALDAIMDRFRRELAAASVDVGALNRATYRLAGYPRDETAMAAVSDAIALLKKRASWFRATEPGTDPAPEPAVNRLRRRGPTRRWLAEALILIERTQGSLSLREMARELEIHHATLSRNRTVKDALKSYVKDRRADAERNQGIEDEDR